LEFVSKGPIEGMWRGEYLKCPICNYYVLKGKGYDECTCGNISVDSDMLRVAIVKSPESLIEVYNAKKKPNKKKRIRERGRR
jgi:hypothetical protein